VQRHYLAHAEAAARGALAPSWAVPFCATWRATLDALERDPDALDRPLDWPVRRALFAAQAARAGFAWPTLRAWNRVAGARAASGGETNLSSGQAEAWRRFEHLRHSLFALDVRYARIGPDGLAARLESTGAFPHRVRPAPSLDDAMWSAPVGRSRLRGRAIARLADRRGGAACDWTSVVDGNGRVLDLTHPLVREARWTRAADEAGANGALPDGIRLRRVLKAHGDRVTWVAWAPDGRLLSASADGTVRVWTTLAGHVLEVLAPHDEAVIGAAWGHDRRVATLSRDGVLRIWSPGLGPPGSDGSPLTFAATAGRGLAWSPAPGAPLVTAAEGTGVSLWGETLSMPGLLEGHAGAVRCVAASPDGAVVASGADHGEMILWDARRREVLARLAGHQGAVRSVAFSSDGLQLASAADDSTVRVWDVPAGSRLAVLRGHRRGVSEVAFSADGAFIASRGEDQLIRLWRADAWREVAAIPDRVRERRPRGLAFHPYRPWLAVPDGVAIRIWELEPEILLGAP
jgi:WD40 repeat protein